VRLATPCRSPWRSRLHRVSQGASVSGRQGLPPASRRPGRERIARTDALSICIGHIGGSLRGGTGTPMGTRYTRGSDSGRPAVALTINLMRFPAPTRRHSFLAASTAPLAALHSTRHRSRRPSAHRLCSDHGTRPAPALLELRAIALPDISELFWSL
jgi:hypothetical protein